MLRVFARAYMKRGRVIVQAIRTTEDVDEEVRNGQG